IKLCPAPMVRAFLLANSIMAGSVPVQRTRHLPDASQKASPNLMPGTAPTSASWMSSTDLMKWVWPRMKLIGSGFSIWIAVSLISIAVKWWPGDGIRSSWESGASTQRRQGALTGLEEMFRLLAGGRARVPELFSDGLRRRGRVTEQRQDGAQREDGEGDAPGSSVRTL